MSKEEIISRLEKLYTRVNLLGESSRLEIDVLKDEIKALYQKVLDWEEEMNQKPDAPEAELHVVQPAEPEIVTPEEVAPEPTAELEEPKVEEPDNSQNHEEVVQEPEPEPVEQPEPPKPEPEAEIPKQEEYIAPEPFQQPVADKPKETSIADKAEAAQPDKSLAAKWHKNPINDLKSGIGLNEKFAFVRILFKGDLESYNAAIDKLNASGDRDSALSYLEALRNERSWDSKSQEYGLLKEFVGRRHT